MPIGRTTKKGRSLPAPVQSVATSRRVALVIGNGTYTQSKPLPNPSNDARAIAKSLRDIGFTVTEGIDLDRACDAEHDP